MVIGLEHAYKPEGVTQSRAQPHESTESELLQTWRWIGF